MTTRMTDDEWYEKAEELYGEDQDDWTFQCPNCGNIQSVNGVMSRLPDMDKNDVRRWINKHCESRFNDSVNCDWALNDKWKQMCNIIVETETAEWRVFEFADGNETEPNEPDMITLDRNK